MAPQYVIQHRRRMFTVCLVPFFFIKSPAKHYDYQLIPNSTSSLDEAKRWFESSTVICKYVPGGKDAAEKVSGLPEYQCLFDRWH